MFNLTNRLRALASIFLVTISIGTAMATVTGVKWNKKWDANTKTLTDDPSGEQKAADWMADLPNNMFVAQVSIPGAHDFATGELGDNNQFSKCQSATMDELLEGGIRAIDFRPGYKNQTIIITPRAAGFYLYHGTQNIQGITFLEGMQKLATYLENHKQEFFVIHIFPGNDNAESDLESSANTAYNEVLNDASVSPYIVTYDPNITVGEARGKILIAVRPKADYLANDKQADIVNWVTTFSSNQRPAQLTLHGQEIGKLNVSARLHVQDISSPSDDGTVNLETKKVHMVNLLEYAQERRTPNEMYALNGYYTPEWFMNFLSMYTSTISSTDSYKENATTMNALLLEKLNGTDGTAGSLGAGPLGIIMMDYCLNQDTNGDQAVYKVIENNFTGGETAPVEKYQIDMNNDWNKYPENPWAGKKLFFRNMGAGEEDQTYRYLGGGGSWGASAVANYAGHFFTIENGNAALRLGSVFGHLQNKDNNYWCDPRDNVDDYGTEFILTPAYWDGNPVWFITCQVCGQRLTAVPFTTTDENGNEVTNNPYYDKPAYNIVPVAADDSDPHQMWQILPMTDDDQVSGYTVEGESRLSRMQRLGNPQRGMDATFLIPSYSFGNSDSSYTDGWTYTPKAGETTGQKQAGWTLTYGQSLTTDISQTTNTVGKQANDKGAMWRAVNTATEGNTFSLSTEVLNLPAGKYNFQFHYVSTAEGVNYKIGTDINTALTKNSDVIADLTPGSAEIDKVGSYFNTYPENCRVTCSFTKGTDATVPLKFEFVRESNVTEAASFYLDNLRLTYLGATDAKPDTIKLRYPKPWGTICLPFDTVVPPGLQVYKATALTGVQTQYLSEAEGGTVTYQVVERNSAEETMIKANTPYLVYHKALVDAQNGTQSATSPRRAETAAELAAKEYEFVGYPINRKNDYHDDAGVLTGLIEARALANTKENYAITSSPLTEYTVTGETIYHADVQYFDQTLDGSESITVAANRAYVNARTVSTEMATADRVYFEDYQVVGVGRVTLDANEPVDVFDVTGICLRSGVKRSEALQGLSTGVYLLKGRSGISKVIHR